MDARTQVVFFDAGGTLFHPHPSVGVIYQRVGIRYGCRGNAEEIERVFRKVWVKHDGMTLLAAYSSEKIEKEWWRKIVREIFSEIGGIEDFENFFEELYRVFADPEVWRLYPGTLEVLEGLKKQKKRLGIISNWDSRLFRLVEGLKLEDYFEFVLASAVFGASKPGPKIFEEGLKKMGIAPGAAVHVGDSMEDDVKGALAAGIPAIWIDRHPKEDRPRTTFAGEFKTIQDLKELLG